MRLNPFARKKSRRSAAASYGGGWGLKSDTKWAIVGVVMLLLAALILLSFFGAAGPTGEKLLAVLKSAVGLLAYPLPLALIVLGVYLIKPREEGVAWLRVVGIILTILGLL